MENLFKTNPHKASAKIQINNNLMVVCLTIFGIMWTFSPERLTPVILFQFMFAVPLLYVSSIAYTKIAYWKNVRLWDYLGWFTGTIGTAFVLNIFGILTFLLGYHAMGLSYFFIIWFLLAVYTIINIYYDPKLIGEKIFKFIFFVIIQLSFGIALFYF